MIAPLSTKPPIAPSPAEPRIQSDLLVDYLEKLGVEYVFGVPGGHIAPLFEALARSEQRGGPRAILTRHESGAASMADAYTRETGKIGVCCGTTGPGATNLLTGVASAYTDHIPLLVITAQTLLPKFGVGAFQESSPDLMDTAAMFDSCTRYNSVVTHPKQLERKLISALTTALQSPMGPAHLSVPVDVFRAPAPESPTYPDVIQLLNHTPSHVDLAALKDLAERINDVLNRGRQIAILVGHGCAGATEAIMQVAELINAPVATTQSGKSWVNPYHPLARGVFGFAGHQSARQAITAESVELVLAVGTGLGQWATSTWDQALLNEKLVHIHHDNSYFTRSPMACLHVCGAPKTVFQQLLGRLKPQPKPPLEFKPHPSHSVPPQIELRQPNSYRSESTPIKPQRLVDELMHQFPPDTRFLVDTGNALAWTIHYFFTPHPENYRSSPELAAMGWGIGGAVGTALGTPNTPVVCLTGDGSFLMNGQEITVAVAEQLPIIFIVLNDRSFGMVKHRHRQVVTDALEFAIPPVDFSLMAQAMGAQGYSIRRPQDLAQLDYHEICTRQGPTLLDVYIDTEEIPPIGMF